VAGSLALEKKNPGVGEKEAFALLESASQLGNVLATRKLYDHFNSKGNKTEATIYVGLLKHQLENLPVYIESQAGMLIGSRFRYSRRHKRFLRQSPTPD